MNEQNQKRPGHGPGTAALILGLAACALFLTGMNLFAAVLAIALGIACLASWEKRTRGALAICAGIAAILLTVGSYARILSNEHLVSFFVEITQGDTLQNELQQYLLQMETPTEPEELL